MKQILIVILAALSLAACKKPEALEYSKSIEQNVKVVRYCMGTSIFEINGKTMMLDSNKDYIEISEDAVKDLCG